MKPILSAAVLAIVASSFPALAGNIAPPVAGPAPAPTADWSGWYGGVSLGYGAGRYDQGVSAADEIGPTVDVDGAIYGLQFGLNFQNGNKVFGVELSASTGIDGLTPQGTDAPDWRCGSGDCNIDIKSMATLRGRFGMTSPSGNTLFYGAAGVVAANYVGGIFNSSQQGGSETNYGLTIGAGVEHMIRPNMSIFGEANYVDLGTLKFGDDDGPLTYDGKGDFATMKFGVNFHF